MSSGVWLSERKCWCDRAVFSWLWSAIYQVCVFGVHGQDDKMCVCVCVCRICVCRRERETDRQVCIQSVCLIRCDGSLVGTSPAVNTYRWLSSLTLFLNEGLCSLVSHTVMHTYAHWSTDMCPYFLHTLQSSKHGQTITLAWTQAPRRYGNVSTSTCRFMQCWLRSVHTDTHTHTHTHHCELTVSPVGASWVTDHWNFF